MRTAQAEDYVNEILAMADGGNHDAQCSIGIMYLNGISVDRDEKKGIEWLKTAAEHGSAEAASKLGIAHYCGIGTPVDYAEALKWFCTASDIGHGPSDVYLVWMYARGQGTSRNAAEALNHYFRAIACADAGDAATQGHLGRVYMMDDNVFGKDPVKSAHYLRLAALQDDADSQYSLGLMYADGFGVERSVPKARMWLGRSLANGKTEASEALEKLSERKVPADVF